jgi:adenylate cyclase class 2
MLEIEAKVRVKNLDAISKKLRLLGAAFLHTVREEDIYLDSPDGTLLKSNCGIRLRKRQFQKSKLKSQIFLTYKGPNGKSAFKSRREIQVQVDDFDAIKNILLALGFIKNLSVNKVRHIWKLGKCEICLDKVRYLGTFVEVEGPNENAIAAILDKLGLDKTKHIPSGYARMTAEKSK